MNNVNKTLYIPLYGKALVSKKNCIIRDPKAEEIWEKEGFSLKGKSRSKWLAYYMAMRAAGYDAWVKKQMQANPKAVVLHVGCGLDSRILRVAPETGKWYDVDFPEVIAERRKYYTENVHYSMVEADMRTEEWKKQVQGQQDAILILEGISMYFTPAELQKLLSDFAEYFTSVRILMDCYTERAAKASKYKNPINDVGVTTVYGYDAPQGLAEGSGLIFVKEHDMTPEKYIEELQGAEKWIFRKLFAGKIAKSMYRMYEFREK